MKKKIFTSIILCFLFSLAHAASPSENLTALLRNIKTMKADFTQNILNKSSQLVRNTEGTMALQRPGMFRWNVIKPVSQLIVANGKKLWIYDKDLEQLTIRTLSSGAGETPALLLSDSTLTFEKEFYVKEVTPSSPGKQAFSLLPKDKSSLFASVMISFVNQTLDEMQLKDHLGQTIVIKFKNIQTNVSLSSSLFRVTVPSNVDVIDETKQRTLRK